MSDQLSIGVLTALIAGALSFLSPCILPVIPGYLSFITGLSLEALTKGDERVKVVGKAVINTLAFVVGFSLVFILLGASATTAGLFLRSHMKTLARSAGLGIIVLGVHMTGLVRIPFLYYEKRIHKEAKTEGLWRAFVGGLFFAFGWTPCVGPILAGILAIAATEQTVAKGILLLSAYSFGLGLLFILSATFLNAFFAAYSRMKRHLHKVEVISGILLIGIGALIFTNKLSMISSKLAFINPEALMVGRTETALPAAPAAPRAVPSGEKAVHASSPAKVDYGKYAFQLKTIDQKPLTLADFGGRVVLVNFWAPWCPPCKLETPGFVRIYEKYRSAGFVMIGIGVSTNEKQVQDFIKQYQIPYPVGIESHDEISDRYGVFGIPASFLFAPDGRLHHRFDGYADERQLESKLKELLDQSGQ